MRVILPLNLLRCPTNERTQQHCASQQSGLHLTFDSPRPQYVDKTYALRSYSHPLGPAQEFLETVNHHIRTPEAKCIAF